jgi:uncharacterized membrane protein (UPF0182 family)
MKKNAVLWVILAIFMISPFFNRVIDLGIDFLWFQEIHLETVFKKILFTQIGMGLVTFLITAIILLGNIILAEVLSSGNSFLPKSIAAYQILSKLATFRKRVFLIASLVVSFFAGIWGTGLWENYLKYKNGIVFGKLDPLFSKDIGFYVFQMPFLEALFYGSFAILFLSFLSSVLIYILRGGIYLGSFPPGMTKKTRIHLFTLAGLIVASLYFHFQFSLYDMVTTGNHILSGAGYAETHFNIPVLYALKIIALCAGVFIWISIGARTMIPALIAIAAVIVLTLSGNAGNHLVQKFIVAPNELGCETPYIERSIAGTREAYDIEKIEEKSFSPSDVLTLNDIEKNGATIKNIRLWDHGPLKTTYSQLQEIRTYYEFLDVDNDRYRINNELRQVMLSPRELVPASLPSRIWINEKLTYTHGYGLCMGPVNQVTKEGLPEFFIKNIPPVSTCSIDISRPEIYFGESKTGYVVVNTKAKEFDFPSGDQNVYSTYQGSGGVSVGGIFKRLLFVAKFKELKLLLSTDIKASSRILMNRQILERVKKASPFFIYDSDPYIVIKNNGELVWIIDGYTYTDKYPYSFKSAFGNYIRNSVKVVIDAYSGKMDFYSMSEDEPIVRSYSKMFPGLLKPFAQMPSDIKEHLRYPQDLFSLQAKVYAEYHMSDPQVFYNKEDLWKIPDMNVENDSPQSMQPYYTIMKLAEVGTEEEFILMVPFTPANKDNMIAWLAARCDGENYGKLLVFNFPKQKLVFGPRQIESRINQDPEISKQLTLWNQGGSRVIRGSLLVIPVEKALLCVQPLYIEAKGGGGLPELKRVIVSFGNTIAMEENLELSLAKIFGIREINQSENAILEINESVASINGSDVSTDVNALIKQAQEEFSDAQNAMSKGDWAAYGKSINRVRDLINNAAKNAK